MSKHHLRKDNICQNCGHTVEKRFCSSCGQENIETRQSFGHLVKHFAEDFTHYEGSFWKTIKYLLFRPAYLTKTYLAGKRVSYVAPVKLYIFVSFITFFLPALLPDYSEEHADKPAGKVKVSNSESILSPEGAPPRTAYTSVRQYDSIQSALPEHLREKGIVSAVTRKALALGEEGSDMDKRFSETASHNFPKALFFYLPLFAFIIWLFHGKQKWYYFDHAIFTLHYFSFILLLFTICNLLDALFPWERWGVGELASLLFFGPATIWSIYYFFRAHRKLYEEKRAVSNIKSAAIFLVNTLLFGIFLLGFVVLTLFMLH
jgi:hypothetical protein